MKPSYRCSQTLAIIKFYVCFSFKFTNVRLQKFNSIDSPHKWQVIWSLDFFLVPTCHWTNSQVASDLICHGTHRADSKLAPSQRETFLQSNTVSHWLGANLKSALHSCDITVMDTLNWCLFDVDPCFFAIWVCTYHKSRVSCQKGPTSHAYAWPIGPFWQDTLDIYLLCVAIHSWRSTSAGKVTSFVMSASRIFSLTYVSSR